MTLSVGNSQKQSPNLFMHGTVIYLTVTTSIVTGPVGDFDRKCL